MKDTSRKGFVGLAVTGIAAAVTGNAAARSGSKRATPVTKKGTTSLATGKTPEFLFIQSAKDGTITPKGKKRFRISLTDVSPVTIAFSDRPDRDVSAPRTASFVKNFNWSAKNPPNAAIVVNGADGKASTVVVELTNPTFSTTRKTLSYDARILDEAQVDGRFKKTLGHTDAGLPRRFTDAQLFIDDCDDTTVTCHGTYTYRGQTMAAKWQADCGTCYHYSWSSACWNCNLSNCYSGIDTNACWANLPTPYPDSSAITLTSVDNPGDTGGDC